MEILQVLTEPRASSYIPIVHPRLDALVVCAGWLYTTLAMFRGLVIESDQMRSMGMESYFNLWNVLDVLRLVCFLMANIVYLPIRFLMADPETGLLEAPFGFARSSVDTAVISLYAVSSLAFAIRAISYFRGWLHFATLVYSILKIWSDIKTFIIVLFVLLLGFTFSLWLLMRAQENAPHGCDFADNYASNNYILPEGVEACVTRYQDFGWFLAASISMALFGEPMNDEMPAHVFLAQESRMRSSDPRLWDVFMRLNQWPYVKTSIFLIFNFMMQVLMLNLLIALMGEARAQAEKESHLAALQHRAELVLEQEDAQKKHQLFWHRKIFGRLQSMLRLCAPTERCDRDEHGYKSRWLHVLIPDELDTQATGARVDDHLAG